jgi:hypothetical protein
MILQKVCISCGLGLTSPAFEITISVSHPGHAFYEALDPADYHSTIKQGGAFLEYGASYFSGKRLRFFSVKSNGILLPYHSIFRLLHC